MTFFVAGSLVEEGLCYGSAFAAGRLPDEVFKTEALAPGRSMEALATDLQSIHV
jgi:hypothetical protein